MDMQTCYTTAYKMRKKSPEKAIEMIENAIAECECSWIDLMRANLNLGLIYEDIRDYMNAEKSFCEALDAVPENLKSNYEADISLNILRVYLHNIDFRFSGCLYVLYSTAMKANSFSLSMRQNLFYVSIAEIIIAEYEKNNDKIKDAINNALSALNKKETTETDRILKKHKYEDDTFASDEALQFLRKYI